MQKNKKKASILLWSIFISMILSILFLSISTKITKNLKNNDDLISSSNIEEKIKNQIQQKNFETIEVNENEYLLFESRNPLIRTIKKDKTISILFNSGATISLKIEKEYGADLYYELYQGNSQNNINTLNSKGLISNKLETTVLDNSNNWGKITLENLGGESKIKISSENSGIPKYINYSIIKVIGNKQIVKEKKYVKLW